MGVEGRAGLAVVSTSRPGQPERLKQLHQWLIEPIADLLPTEPNAPIIFIPQDFLFSVSFAALQDTSGQYLIEKHTILTAPAIQILDLTHQQQQRLTAQQRKPLQGKDVLVVGNPTMPTLQLGDTVQQLPPLPGSQQEAEAIAKQFHPCWSAIKFNYVHRLMIRSTFQVLGIDLKSPADFVLCWTPDGSKGYKTSPSTGGTGQALRLAYSREIRIYNLANPIDFKLAQDWVNS